MPLTEEQRQAIRDEEFFRDEVRKELAGPHRETGFFERCAEFFETRFGYWVLTTLLAGVAVTGYTSLQRWIDRDEIAQRENAERSRRDMETVLKLGPMLTSERRSQVDVAIVLLDGLASDNALDGRIANQVRALVQNTLATGLKEDASEVEKKQAEAILSFADKARLDAIQRPESEVSPPVSPIAVSAAIDKALPVRVYLQIASERDRAKAVAANGALRKAGLIVPGIELVPARNAPRVNELRYCEAKVDAGALERVQSAAAEAVIPAPRTLVLAPRLCGSVRFNHFELWYALGSE